MRRTLGWLWGVLLIACVLLASREAQAYPWMIRHQYTGCAQCHTDPSGGGLLTAYGRAQSGLLLRTRYGAERKAEEAGRADDFAFGAVTLPEWLQLGGTYRGMGMAMIPPAGKTSYSFVQMQADAKAHVSAGPVRVYASVGGEPSGASRAIVARAGGGGLVSREHWIGLDLADSALLVRAGRIALPFGIRMIEHTMFVRESTRTDMNAAQQHGVSLAWSLDWMRGEVMGVAGNYLVKPDAFRERGYSAYVEFTPAPVVGLGASSLLTHAAEDYLLLTGNTRQAHGAFARVSPWQPLVLMVEGDYLHQTPSGIPSSSGYAGMLTADLEPLQGLHFAATGETMNRGTPGEKASLGGWLSTTWFFAPHADVRLDAIRNRMSAGGMTLGVTTLLAQLHFFL